MNYIVLETQTTGDVTAVVPAVTYSDRLAAESKFHQILSVAAASNVEEHTAYLLTSDGRLVRNECYRHPQEPTPEPEPEVNGDEDVE